MLEKMGDEIPEKQRKRMVNGPTLGTLISVAENSKLQLAVPFENLWSLSKVATTLLTSAKILDNKRRGGCCVSHRTS